jgi:hypothetical protein
MPGIFDNVMSMFGSKPANLPPANQGGAAPNQQQPITNNPATNPQPGQTHQSATVAPNGVVPQGAAEESPLKEYADVWQPTPVDPNKKEPAVNQLTNEHFMEAAGKIDFTKVITSDQMQKIQGGGDDAIKTLVEVMNKTSQVTMGQSLAGANKLIDQKLAEARKEFSQNIPRTVRDQNVKEALFQQNKLLADPAVAPMVVAMQQQLSERFPHASEQEILQKAQDYVIKAGQAFAPQPKKEAAKVPADQDWSDL